MSSCPPGERQELLNLAQGKEEAIPQFFLLALRQPTSVDLTLDFLPGLKRRLFVSLGKLEAAIREAIVDEFHLDGPIPGRSKARDLLSDGSRAQRAFVHALSLCTPVNVLLQLNGRQCLKRKAGSKTLDEVPKVHGHGVQGILLHRTRQMRSNVAVLQL